MNTNICLHPHAGAGVHVRAGVRGRVYMRGRAWARVRGHGCLRICDYREVGGLKNLRKSLTYPAILALFFIFPKSPNLYCVGNVESYTIYVLS